MDRPKVAFICTHNSCRSQMAEAIARLQASDAFDAYSAGTQIKPAINPDAVRCIKRLFSVDMEAAGQYPKLISALPMPDILVTMGCGVQCPFLPAPLREDWGLEDPTWGSDARFDETAKVIERNVLKLRERVLKSKQSLTSS